VEGIEQVLLPGKEIVTFQSEQEMIDMIRYYLEHDEARKNIAEAGKARVLRDHTYEVRIEQMFRMIDEVT
jgi:spore maturation protein CgeB